MSKYISKKNWKKWLPKEIKNVNLDISNNGIIKKKC